MAHILTLVAMLGGVFVCAMLFAEWGALHWVRSDRPKSDQPRNP